MKAKSTFPCAGIDQEIHQARRPDNPPFLLQFAPRLVSTSSNPLRFLRCNVRSQGSDPASQKLIVRRSSEVKIAASTSTRLGRRQGNIESDERQDGKRNAYDNPPRPRLQHSGRLLYRLPPKVKTDVFQTP